MSDSIQRTSVGNFPISQTVTVPASASLIFVSGTLPDLADTNAPAGTPAAYGNTEVQTVSVFNTGGVGLWTRSGPGFGADALQILPEDTQMTLLCQVHSELVVDWISTDLWDYVRLSDGQLVWVSDAFVYTGADGQVAPAC